MISGTTWLFHATDQCAKRFVSLTTLYVCSSRLVARDIDATTDPSADDATAAACAVEASTDAP